jgi:hypothetical protein
MLKKNNLHQGHEVKQHGNKIEADGWPHNWTSPFYCLVQQYREAPIWQTPLGGGGCVWMGVRACARDASFTTSVLMMETEEISEMLVFSWTLSQLIAWEEFSTFIHHETFEPYTTNFCLSQSSFFNISLFFSKSWPPMQQYYFFPLRTGP